MVRRQKRHVLKDLPPKTRQLIELDHPQQAMAQGQYRQLASATQRLQDLFRQRENLNNEFEDNPAADTEAWAHYQSQAQKLDREAKVAFERMSQVRKETALSKVPQVLDLALTSLDNGKLILFCHHQEVAEAYRDALNTHFRKRAGRRTPNTVAMVTGQTPEGQRQKEADRFQDDPLCQVFIGTIQAAGAGLTLTAASAVLFAELDWVPGKVTQAEDRAHRIGQRDHVLVYHAVVEGTLDSLMVRRLIEKQAVIDSALDTPEAPRPKPKRTPDTKTEQERFADWCLDHFSGTNAQSEPVSLIPATGADTGEATQSFTPFH